MYGKTLCAALALCAVAASAPAQTRTLKIATLSPDGASWMVEMRKGGDEIAQRTGGRVKLKFYPGGVMGNDKTVLRKVRSGQLQGGAFTGGGLAEVAPDAQVYGLPFLFHSLEEVDYVRRRLDPVLAQALETAGMVVLGIGEGGFAYLLSSHPVRVSADLRGRKVWVPEGDRVSQAGFEAAGVTPVPLAIADVYTGLQTGLVDTIASSALGALTFQWHTKVKHLTDVPLMYLVGILAVDGKAFETLTPDDRAVVREVMARIFTRFDRQNRLDDAAARKALASQGIAFETPGPEDLARWRAIAVDAIARLRGKGVYTDETLALLRGHLEDFRAGRGR